MDKPTVRYWRCLVHPFPTHATESERYTELAKVTALRDIDLLEIFEVINTACPWTTYGAVTLFRQIVACLSRVNHAIR